MGVLEGVSGPRCVVRSIAWKRKFLSASWLAVPCGLTRRRLGFFGSLWNMRGRLLRPLGHQAGIIEGCRYHLVEISDRWIWEREPS
jgi:hypothetical protein